MRAHELAAWPRDASTGAMSRNREQLGWLAAERKNWLLCWTEVGALHAGIVQSLIATRRLHGVDPYTCFVDELQRVGQHPASRVAELTPRLRKRHFAEQPLRLDLHGTGLQARPPAGCR